MISTYLQGGLGNQLFQIAKCLQVSKQTNRKMWLPIPDKTVHSEQDYFTTIFQSMSHLRQTRTDYTTVYENKEYDTTIENIQLSGYFQDYRSIPDDFLDYLTFPSVDPLEGVFLHIRGGDYKGHWLHDVGLSTYYERATALFPKGTMFYIFTNDIQYAKSLLFLNTIDHVFVEEDDECKALALMKQCKLGGICANSTFSWWAAFLSHRDRTLVLPSKWFNDPSMYTEGYFFPGSTVL